MSKSEKGGTLRIGKAKLEWITKEMVVQGEVMEVSGYQLCDDVVDVVEVVNHISSADGSFLYFKGNEPKVAKYGMPKTDAGIEIRKELIKAGFCK